MDIRKLTEAEADAFWTLRLRGLRDQPEAFGSSYEDIVRTPLEKRLERMRQENTKPDNFILGAFEDATLVGVVGFLRESSHKTQHRGYIWGMYVAPEGRGRGAGRLLLQEVIRLAKELPGLEYLRLQVGAANQPARQLYQSLGFELCGTEPRALKIGDQYFDEELRVLNL